MGIRKCAAEAPLLKGIPSEYMTNGQIFYSCESEEETLPYVLERAGDEIILYASDYPHWNSTTKDREVHCPASDPER